MPRGFGRGAKTVGIVTHAQAKTAGKKTPRGLRGTRQKKRERYQKRRDPNVELEESLKGREGTKSSGPKTFAEEVAGIYIPHVINKRQKGLKALRKQILSSVKEITKARSNKAKKK